MGSTRHYELYYDDLVDPVLVAAFGDLCSAKLAMNTLAIERPGRYFVWLSVDEEVVALLDGSAESE